MHCEGCAKKVRRCLTGFEGVEDVQTDCTTHKVVVKGKNADPLKVLERVQMKSHRQVELLSPIPKPPAADAKKSEDDKAKAKPEEKKEEVIIVVLKVHMHCEGCAQGMRKRIQRMKGVEAADPDLASSQVTVKGIFDPAELVETAEKENVWEEKKRWNCKRYVPDVRVFCLGRSKMIEMERRNRVVDNE
ncbi:hypothetical protein HHK36_025200 [Tetracentron sinense]|uniref:HMA domain-containing protein n=1 Tax=Tetracentron sinense TaxID=13715 RepID=A0A835D4Z1_TETSI|nr:hypothetical protein HHK36_025200 [Tetracentron sinense]